ANAGYFVIGLHALAALLHHYWWKDNTLLRMMPRKR
ncbi:cytochrome b561, partial [Escherichia coli]|nr:cytochrome b561 [Escherichia coli]